jgi:hypothetical protein
MSGEDAGLDAALADAWSRLSGRHREVLYLREVLGFSYKEIGAFMGLSMPATETLVFRARAALRREYERSGGSSFGCLLLGFQLARLGGDRREAGVADRLTSMAMSDPGFGGFASRLTQFLSTSLPGCGEQALAKMLSLAAGVVMAAASMTAGLGPFGDAPSAGATGAPKSVSARGDQRGGEWPAVGAAAVVEAPGPSRVTTGNAWTTLLGDAVPAGWRPPRSGAATTTVSTSAAGEIQPERPRPTPVRDVVEAARSADRPQWRPERDEARPGPLRSILAARAERPERPRPIRSLLEDPIPLALDALPLDLGPISAEPVEPVEPVPAAPVEPQPPAETEMPDDQPTVRETVEPPVATFAGDERTPLRLRDR